MADVNDSSKAENAVDAIGDYLEEEGLVDIDDSEEVQRWRPVDEPEVEDFGVTIDSGVLMVGYPADAVEETADGSGKSLADTEDWQRTLDLLPPDTTSIWFFSLSRIFDELRGTEAEDEFNESTDGEMTLEDLSAIRSVGLATTSREDGFGMHFVVFMEDR
jgi:hypothetical protein